MLLQCLVLMQSQISYCPSSVRPDCELEVRDWLQAERAARERAEEDEFRRQTMERFAEQDRLEQMNAQKRRLKLAEHAREVERLIQEKKQMYQDAMVSLVHKHVVAALQPTCEANRGLCTFTMANAMW